MRGLRFGRARRGRGGAMTGRLMLVLLMVSVCIGTSAQPAVGEASSIPGVSAAAALLMDYQTGRVLYGYQATKELPPASTTKIITALLGLEMGQAGEMVTVSPYAAGTDGTSLGLQQGLIFDLHDLIEGALVNSGNDAAVAIGEHLAGNENLFASLMTCKALTIGALRSNFVNPNGLDSPGHYCTAYDLALITRYALNNPLFRQFVQTREDVIYESRTRTPVQLNNTNRLLWNTENREFRVIGVKTGTTSSAGQCLVAAADRQGQLLVAVVLGSSDRYADILKLLRYGYDQCSWYKLPKDQGMLSLAVDKKNRQSITVAPVENICFAVAPQDEPLLSKQVDIQGISSKSAPAGALVGRVGFYLGDHLIIETGLKTLTPITKKSILF